MEKVSYRDRVRNIGLSLLLKVKYERNVLHRSKRRKANWIGCILVRKCLLKHVIYGKIERRVNNKKMKKNT